MRFLIVLLLTSLAFAQETTSLYGGKLTAKIPPGLYNLTKKAIEEGYGERNRPQHVFKNQLGDFSVAFKYLDTKVSPLELTEFQDNLKKALESKLESVQWLSSSTRTIQNKQWFVLEFKSMEGGFFVHNWVLGTSWGGRLLEVTVGVFDDLDPELTSSVNQFIQSLTFVEKS